MPINTKIGGPVKYVKDRETICFTNDEARHINTKVESEGIVNEDTIKQEIEDKWGSNNIDDAEVNQYHEIIIYNKEKENIITLQMEQWSILSNVVNYVHCERHPRNFYDLDVKTID